MVLFLLLISFQMAFAIEYLSVDDGISLKDSKKMVHVIETYVKSWNEDRARGLTKDFAKKSDLITNLCECYQGKKSIQDHYNHLYDTFFNDSIFQIEGLQLILVSEEIVMGYVEYQIDSVPRLAGEEMLPGVVIKGMLSHVFREKDSKWEIVSTQNTLKRGF
jgi:hypothetical protein